MTLEHRYAISLLVQRPGPTPTDKKVLLSLRDPAFHHDLGDVWGLAFSRYLTPQDYETLIAPKSEKTQPILHQIEADIMTNKLEEKLKIHIDQYVAHDTDIRVDQNEPGSTNFVLHMVVFTADFDGDLPASTKAYKDFKFLTVNEYIELRTREAAIGKQCGICTNIMLDQEQLRKAEEKYRDEADKECIKGKIDVFTGMWDKPEMVQFFANLPVENLTQSMGDKIENILSGKGKVLIVGGATGRLGRYIAQRFPDLKVTEIDLSPLMVRSAQELAKQNNIKTFNSLIADAFKLPFANETFDLVVSQGFLRHFQLQEGISLTEEMKRSGKRILIAEANSGGSIVQSLAEKYNTNTDQENMVMPRISLFAHLYHRYNTDPKFKKFVDQTVDFKKHHFPDIDPITYLSQIARSEEGTLFSFTI